MSVENKGWMGGGGSMADALFDPASPSRDVPSQLNRITDGPLAGLDTGHDLLAQQRAWNSHVDEAMVEKQARIIGGDNSFDSSTHPGGNRVIQNQGGASTSPEVQQGVEAGKAPADGSSDKPSKAPGQGAKGSEIMARIRARRAEKGDVVGEETSSKSLGAADSETKHNLQVKDPAPVPKELTPSNLADYHGKSSWVGSGPRAALHNDYSKVGALLDYAGVPARPLPDSSILSRLALTVLSKEASGTEYLARDDVHPLKLVAELEDTLGQGWDEWEPETIRESIVKEAGIEPSDDVMSKIMAVKIVTRRPDVFYDSWQSMEKISVALNNRSPVMGAVEDVPIEWLSNAVSIVSKIASDHDFSPEVQKYVAARLHDQGYVVAPPPLRFADGKLAQLVGDSDFRGKVILAYARALDDDKIDESEDPVGIQVARLLRNNAFVLDSLDESREQLA